MPFLVSASVVFLPCSVSCCSRSISVRQTSLSALDAVQRAQRPVEAVWALLGDRAGVLVPAGVGHVFAQVIRSGRNTIIPLYAAGALSLDVDRVGLLMGIAAVEMVMFAPAGWLMDHLGRKAAIVPSFTIQAVDSVYPFDGGLCRAAGLRNRHWAGQWAEFGGHDGAGGRPCTSGSAR